ncbi:MAG: class II fructose-bisphosphatase [Rhodospirillales bacterium]|nr:class II fructose-bisphosphatase [Rhodospirillales bacterium]
MTSVSGPATPPVLFELTAVTEAAARAAYDWIGRGDKEQGDAAAVDAMRAALGALEIDGTIVVGEGEKDEAPGLYNGERVGNPDSPIKLDIAVDPVEGTSYLAKGLTNAMAVIALAPRGAMFDPGPAFYMEKLAVPPAAKGKIDVNWPTAEKLRVLAAALSKKISDLRVFVLEKPRHRTLIEEIHKAGARVSLYPAGDVAGALMAAIPDSGIDALMGTGGTPEGLLSACAIRALGGEFLGRINPQLQTETAAVRKAGIDTVRWYSAAELVRSDEVYFCATGITTGLLFDGVERTAEFDRTQTLMISGATGERQILTSYRRLGRQHPAS